MDRYWKSDLGVLDRWVGWQIPLQAHWICPTYHPSFLLRMKNELMDRLFSAHLKAAFEIDEDPPELKDFRDQIEVLYDEREIYKALREIDKEGGLAAVDYESNCLKPEWPEAKIYSCAVSNGRRTISYPWAGRSIEDTGQFLRSTRTGKVSSNLKMEERWTLKVFGHGVTNWAWDTMLAAHCLDNRPGICSLKFQSLVKLGIPSTVYNENIEPYLSDHQGHYNRIQEIDIATLLYYGGMDGLQEVRLAKRQRREMGVES